MDPRSHPYWNESQGRIVIPQMTADGFIIHSQSSREHKEVLNEMGFTPDKDIFHEDTLLYLRERDKNIKVGNDLAWLADPASTAHTLGFAGRGAVTFAKNRRYSTRIAKRKLPAIANRTAKTTGAGAAAGFQMGGPGGAVTGAGVGFFAGVGLGVIEVFWSIIDDYTGYRPEGVGLDYDPKKKQKTNSLDIPDAD